MFFCPVPKISQVMMKWRRRASHLGRFTSWNNGRLATQLSRFALWHNGHRAKQPGLMHAPGVARIFQKKYEGIIQSKFYSGCKLSANF